MSLLPVLVGKTSPWYSEDFPLGYSVLVAPHVGIGIFPYYMLMTKGNSECHLDLFVGFYPKKGVTSSDLKGLMDD